MPKRIMSDAELNRRRKLQGKIGRTTATLGLTGAALGVGALAAKKPGALKAVEKVPGLNRATHEGLKEGALYTGIAAGGIGGVGGFNQASIYSAESRKRKQVVPVKKDFGMEMGYYGEEGHPLTHEELEAEIEKAWTPSASNFDSERDRKKRGNNYSTAAVATGGAGAAYGAHHGVQAIKHGRKIKSEHMAPTFVKPARDFQPEVQHVPFKAGSPEVLPQKKVGKKGAPGYIARRTGKAAVPDQPEIKGVKEKAARGPKMAAATKKAGYAYRAEHLSPALKHGGKAAVGAGVAAGAIAVGAHLKRKKNSSWQPYSKRDDGIEKKLSRKEKGAVAGAAGGVFGPVGSATASGVLAPKGKKIKHTAIGAGAGLAGPLGGAASGYYAAGATKKKKVSKRDTESAFGVEHGEVSKLFGKKRKGLKRIGNVSDQDASALMAMQGKYGKGKVSKASVLGAGSRLSHEVGAGGLAATKLGESMGPARHPSNFAYGAHRAQAKKAGKVAGKHFGANGDLPGFGARYHANTGWQQRAESVRSLPASKPAPVGMKGPITSRVKTKKMKANEERFL